MVAGGLAIVAGFTWWYRGASTEASCIASVLGAEYAAFAATDLNWSRDPLLTKLEVQEGEAYLTRHEDGSLEFRPGGRVALRYSYPVVQYGELRATAAGSVPEGVLTLKVWEEYEGGVTDNGERVRPIELHPERTEYVGETWVFRHVELSTEKLSAPLLLTDVAVTRTLYPTTNRGYFHSSDEALNAIWEMGRHTLRLSMLPEAYVDSAQRDRALWVGDMREQALINYYTFGDTALLERSLRTLRDQVRAEKDGLYPSIWQPHGTNGDVANQYDWVLLDYVSRYAQQVREWYQFSGDERVKQEFFADAIDQVAKLQRFEDEQGLLSVPEGLGPVTKWSSENVHGVSAYQQVIYSIGLQSAAEMAEALGQQDQAGAYREKRAQLIAKSKERFFDGSLLHERSKEIIPIRFDTNVFALAAGWFDEPASLIEALEPFRTEYGYKLATTEGDERVAPLPNGELAIALSKAGYATEALSLITRHWGRMRAVGATSTWEFMDGGDLTGSVTHAWSGTPTAILPSTILGIEPVEPGFAVASITPRLGTLAFASGVVPTPQGLLAVRFEQENGRLKTAKVCRPRGVDASLHLPENLVATVRGRVLPQNEDGGFRLPAGKSEVEVRSE